MSQFRLPTPRGEARAEEAQRRRCVAAKVAKNRPSPPLSGDDATTEANGDEARYPDTRAASFTKGLAHTADGVLADPQAYLLFRKGVNQEDAADGMGDFIEETVPTIEDATPSGAYAFQYRDGRPEEDRDGAPADFPFRGWESPRAGHAYDLQGADADALCMPPAPAFFSEELAYEMTEVYALALLRDVPFDAIASGTDAHAAQIVDFLNTQGWLDRPAGSSASERRRTGRPVDAATGQVTPHLAFRGSSPGCEAGGYLSQFMLVGNTGRAGERDPEEGYILYGSNEIDQRILPQEAKLDFMTRWPHWLDVQNGADVARMQRYKGPRRFITTPRDLATYVRVDQLYQAYLNAALILLDTPIGFEPGFPSGPRKAKRASFATFGGPHLLALLTEVSSRALRAVRRQKFNYHNRCRPEAIGGRLTLVDNAAQSGLGSAATDAETLFNAIPGELLEKIRAHNAEQNKPKKETARGFACNGASDPFAKLLLLPMAFPEGSPMHPAYGAGHATVAGACVTILKAFFNLFQADEASDAKGWAPRPWSDLNLGLWKVAQGGGSLGGFGPGDEPALTIQGELNKLAANISIGRNMAGVHYYSDYYDSVRLGERIAISILQEQMTNYPEMVSMRLTGFDGERITICGSSLSRPEATSYQIKLELGLREAASPIRSPNTVTDPSQLRPFTREEVEDWWICVPATRGPILPPVVAAARTAGQEGPVTADELAERGFRA